MNLVEYSHVRRPRGCVLCVPSLHVRQLIVARVAALVAQGSRVMGTRLLALSHFAVLVGCSTYSLRLGANTSTAATPMVAAAHSGDYGPQPYREQSLVGELVVDPYIFALSAPLRALGLAIDDVQVGCHPQSHLTRAQIEGKVVLVSISNLYVCTLHERVDATFVELAALGATGILLLLPEYGTRDLCSISYGGVWGEFGPNVPQPKVPVFCINLGNNFVAELLGVYFLATSALVAQNGTSWHLPDGNASAPLILGEVALKHDDVPIEALRSDAFYYGYYVPNAAYALLLVAYSGRLLLRMLRRGYLVPSFPLTFIVLDVGLLANSVRAIQFILSPIDFSPRFMTQPGSPWGRFIKTFPHVPSGTAAHTHVSFLYPSASRAQAVAFGPPHPPQHREDGVPRESAGARTFARRSRRAPRVGSGRHAHRVHRILQDGPGRRLRRAPPCVHRGVRVGACGNALHLADILSGGDHERDSQIDQCGDCGVHRGRAAHVR